MISLLSLEIYSGTEGSVTVTVDMLTVALWMASVLFFVCLVLSYRKLLYLQQTRPELSTKKLLILSIALVCIVRIMTILGVTAMNIANVRAHYSLQPIDHRGDKNQAFYDKAMTVLLDLPNCMVVSTYMLLTLVWAECCLEARLHNEDTTAWKRRWLTLYMGFNTVLYTAQLILYVSIFIAGDRLLRTILYPAITGINFFSVVLVLVLYLYLNVRFSGFPFRSESSRRSIATVSKVMVLWSMTRILWGLATLLVFLWNIELLQDSHTPVWSFVVLFLLFFVCEIIPIIALLDSSYFAMLGLENMSRPVPELSNGTIDILSVPFLQHHANNMPSERNN